jgi:hypothetical protein
MIYGTIVATAVTATVSEDTDATLLQADAIVIGSAFVFWLAHVYARVLAEAVESSHKPSFADLRAVARHEHAILRASLPFVVVLTLGALGVYSRSTAFTLAVWGGIGILVLWGLVYGRQAGLGTKGLVGITMLNLAIALVIVGLKTGVNH